MHAISRDRIAKRLRSMIQFSKQQAIARGLIRKSTHHGEDEWRAVTAETFKFSKKLTETQSQGGRMEIEAGEAI